MPAHSVESASSAALVCARSPQSPSSKILSRKCFSVTAQGLVMFEILLIVAAAISVIGLVAAYDGSKDVFHPLIFIAPMLIFLYSWMPWKLLQHDGLNRFFDNDQLRNVQVLNVLGILAFVAACLAGGVRLRGARTVPQSYPLSVLNRLMVGGTVLGVVGLTCWIISVKNVGGLVAAFSTSYSGGFDDSGYVRDGAMLLLVALLLIVTSLSAGGPRVIGISLAIVFGLPWLTSALLMGRRGPTFNLAVVLLMGWYFNRTKRPPLLVTGAFGLLLGWFVLFLVTNRSQLYLGSSFDFKSDVSNVVDKPDTGNEFIYGTGSVVAAEHREHYFWMRRYLAQLLVRPIPSAIWPTKYEDFGVPELLHNAGTGEGFGDALGWIGAVGSAPGIIADFFVEVWWFAVPLMGVAGWLYGYLWRRAVTEGGPWATQYIIFSALSIYLVMQTGEAVIYRTLELSVPCWFVWRWSLKASAERPRLSNRFYAPSELRQLQDSDEVNSAIFEIGHPQEGTFYVAS